MKLIKNIHQEVLELLNEEVPMFTLQLAKGLSFAENPPWYKISFGQSRSQIIARGLLKAWNEKVPAENVSDFLRLTIIENNLNPEKFYLNPRSSYEYDFSCFES